MELLEVVKQFINSQADINTVDNNQNTLLSKAINSDDTGTTKVLDPGVNPNIPDIYGNTPLYIAIINRSLEMTSLLIASGADPNIRPNDVDSCLYVALLHNSPEIEKLLPANCAIKQHT